MGVGCSCGPTKDVNEVPGNEPTPLAEVEEDRGPETESEPPEEEEEVCPWILPPGGQLTAMMFGMTGAGKSSLGNLIARSNVFAAGDDTASITNMDSIMKFEAEDASLTLLDTIGLGDTEIDQEKVVASIRDTALSAINGIDCLLFVMRNVRITDDAIMRLIYVTEYLWGHECLLNLYIVVTCASKYLRSRKDADDWIKRQVEINWRFKHIYGIVGNNPNRFIFVDNPDLDSGEPAVDDRRKASYEAVMKMLVTHPREVIPPFTHEMMRQAQQMTEAERQDLQAKEKEVKRLQSLIGGTKPKSKAKSKGSTGSKQGSAPPKKRSQGEEKVPDSKKPQPQETAAISEGTSSNTESLEETLSKAKTEKLAAQKAMEAKLAAIRNDKKFQQQAQKQAEWATYNFSKFLPSAEGTLNMSDEDAAVMNAKANASKRMMGMLKKGGRRKSKEVNEIKSEAPAMETEEELNRILDETMARVRKAMNCTPSDMFRKLGGWEGCGALQPVVFLNFLAANASGIKPHHIGALWRRADANCDGQIDLMEFRALFGEAAFG